MSRSEFTKSELRELRQLAGDVYETEAHSCLEELAKDFGLWRTGKMLSSDLLTSIHLFHQHQNRELWLLYQGLSDEMIVQRGLRLGLISDTKVSPALFEKLRRGI